MKCAKCGAVIPSQSKFCLSCGEPVKSPVKESVPSATARKRSSFWAMLIALLLVASIATIIALKGRGDRVLDSANVSNPQQAPLLNAPNAPSVPQPGILQNQNLPVTPAEPKSGPPPEVVAYLEHIKKVEMYRRSMRLDLAPAFDMLKKAYSIRDEPGDDERQQTNQEITTGYSDYVSKWQQIVAYFNSVKAPSGCEQLSGAYGEALGNYSSVMIKIQYALVKNDLSTLMSLKGTVQANIDSSLRKADNELAAVCKNFGINKSFVIETDEGVDSLLSPNP